MTADTIRPRLAASREITMDRESVEDLVHAALGRQLRITCLLGLLFLGVGFVLGHMVAGQHARELADRWSDRATELSQQVERLEVKLQGELNDVRTLALGKQAAAQQLATEQANRDSEMLGETRRLAKATEDLRRSLIARYIEETEREKARVLSELQPFVDRRMTLKASEVSDAVNRLVDSQINHLKNLAQAEQTIDSGVRQVASTGTIVSIRSEISPVSAESGICPPPQLTSLAPIADAPQLPMTSEPKPIAPVPPSIEPITLAPVPPAPEKQPDSAEAAPTAATATSHTPAITPPLPVSKPPFFQAPLRPRLFIPAGKAAAVKSASGPGLTIRN